MVERRIRIEEVLNGVRQGTIKEIFGSGTAAVISPVGELSWKGELSRWGRKDRTCRPTFFPKPNWHSVWRAGSPMDGSFDRRMIPVDRDFLIATPARLLESIRKSAAASSG